jgi:hypothetical protein
MPVMLRPTGPGKIRDIVIPADGHPDTTIMALLYNFDFDGDAVKPQHRDWLREHIVPQLGDSRVSIRLRGEASRRGSSDYNLGLSQRRERNIETFLRSFSPVAATIRGVGVGERDAEAVGVEDNTDDEVFRAVFVTVEQSAHRLVPPTFTTSGNFMGFDPTADPPWLMLPAGAIPRIMSVNNAEGLTLVSTNPGAVRVLPALGGGDGRPVRITQPSQLFRLQPGTTADAFLNAVDAGGRVHARMAVSVLTEKIVTCAFHYVQNPRYGTRLRNPGDEADFLDRMNDIWGSQGNLRFRLAPNGVRLLPLTENLGDSIDTNAKFDRIVAHRFPGVQFNVFFVRDIEQQGPTAGTDNADGLTTLGPPGDCVFEDPDGSGVDAGLQLAHEAGHNLTLDHNSPIVTTDRMLMFAAATRPFLPKVHVLQARRAVRR